MKNKGENLEDYYLGIDLGTSSMKFILINGQREVLLQFAEQYETAQPKREWSEIDPEIWYQCLICGMKKLFQNVDAKYLRGIGVTGQMHTLVIIGTDGKPIRPAIVWNDMRTKDMIPEMKRAYRKFSDGAYLADMISTGSPAAGLYWIKKEEPELFGKISKFLIGPDYLVYRLTGCCTTDYCEASTSCLYDTEKRCWLGAMQDFLGLEDSVYPQIGASACIAGRVTRKLAEELGLPENVFVLYGTGDNPATALSTGCLGQKYPVISLGTSGVLMIPVLTVRQRVKGKRILLSIRGDDFQYLLQGVVQSMGKTLDWWIKKICKEDNYEEMERLSPLRELTEKEVMFYPHLMGEKTIHADPALRGAFLGLSIETGRKELLYALLEGLSMGFRELSEQMQVPLNHFADIKVVGGGSRSDTWMQILANVLQKRVERMDGVISPGYGAALLAAFRGGCVPKLEELTSGIVTVQKCFEPDRKAAYVIDKRYEKYCKIYGALQSLA